MRADHPLKTTKACNRLHDALVNTDDQSVLLEAARNQSLDEGNRCVAVRKLTDSSALGELARDGNPQIVRAAIDGIQDVAILVQVARAADVGGGGPSATGALRERIRMQVIGKLVDEGALLEIAQLDTNSDVAEAALRRLKNERLLARVATGTVPSEGLRPYLRGRAAERVSDASLLAEIVRQSRDPLVRGAAIGRVDDQALLREVALNDASGEVRAVAASRLTDPTVLCEIIRHESPLRLMAIEMLKVHPALPNEGGRKDASAETPSQVAVQATLADVALTDEDPRVREAAVEKLRDYKALETVSSKEKDPRVRLGVAKVLGTLQPGAVATVDLGGFRALAVDGVGFDWEFGSKDASMAAQSGMGVHPTRVRVHVLPGEHTLKLQFVDKQPDPAHLLTGVVISYSEPVTVAFQAIAGREYRVRSETARVGVPHSLRVWIE